ncbi:MAG: hypothetical protein SFT91_03405 [Rickettsiaceae bacterium]|nr:hypothetical protein [Rickettsiaceae bacterium]
MPLVRKFGKIANNTILNPNTGNKFHTSIQHAFSDISNIPSTLSAVLKKDVGVALSPELAAISESASKHKGFVQGAISPQLQSISKSAKGYIDEAKSLANMQLKNVHVALQSKVKNFSKDSILAQDVASIVNEALNKSHQFISDTIGARPGDELSIMGNALKFSTRTNEPGDELSILGNTAKSSNPSISIAADIILVGKLRNHFMEAYKEGVNNPEKPLDVDYILAQAYKPTLNQINAAQSAIKSGDYEAAFNKFFLLSLEGMNPLLAAAKAAKFGVAGVAGNVLGTTVGAVLKDSWVEREKAKQEASKLLQQNTK